MSTILVVDDEVALRSIIIRTLERNGYQCRGAESVSSALESVEECEPEVVVSDIRMPGGDGTLLLEELKKLYPDVMVILMTAFVEIDIAIESLRSGASDFLTKPVRPDHLLTSIDRALERRHLIQENRKYQTDLELRVEQATAELREARDSIAATYRQTLDALSSALDARESETGNHSRRVMRLSLRLAEHLGCSEEEMEDLTVGALLHDLGKIGVPDGVLLKNGKLDDEEWKLMRCHPEIGYNILSGIPFLLGARDVVLHHHESFDGRGYPRGLSGTSIPLVARFF